MPDLIEVKSPHRKAQDKYLRTPKGKAGQKARQSRYSNYPKSKAGRARYQRSPKGKAARVRYLNSAKGKVYQAAARVRRRTKYKASLISDLTSVQWDMICQEHGHLCHYCHQSRILTMDHVIPLSKGGNHTASNIVPACRSCNSHKGAKLLNST
jgi:5-methylcytosine-specific restriction endonuclease McrA